MTINKTTQYTTDPNTIPVDTSTGSQTIDNSLDSRLVYVNTITERDALTVSVGQQVSVRGIIYENTGVGAWGNLSGFTTPEAHGATGDGSADDTTAVTDADAEGVRLEGVTGSIYRITSAITISSTEFSANGSSFSLDFSLASPSYAITISSGIYAGEIKASVPTTRAIDRALLFSGAGSRVGNLSVTSVDQQNNRNDPLDSAVTVKGDDTDIVESFVENFDNPYVLDSVNNFHGRNAATSYVRGLYARDTKNSRLLNPRFTIASPNASYTAGHNAILIESTSSRASSGIKIDKPHIEDSGEHGIRLGGQFTIEDTVIDHAVVINSGGSGIKALGAAGELHEGLTISSPIIVDSGQDVSNKSGILIQRCRFVQVTSPNILARSKVSSAFDGIRLTNVSDVIVSNPLVTDVANDGVLIDSGGLGGSNRVTIDGGQIRNSGARGFHLTMGDQSFSHIMVKNRMFITGCPEAFDFEVTTGSLTRGFFSAELYFNTASGDALGVVAAEIVGELDAGVAFRNGSTYMDYGSQEFKVRKSGTWTAVV